MTLIGIAVLLVEGGRGRAARSAHGARREPAGSSAARMALMRRPADRALDLPGASSTSACRSSGSCSTGADRCRGRGRARRDARSGWAAAGRSARSPSSSRSAARIALLVGPVLGETTPHFPLYVVEALLVELRRAWSSRAARPLRFGAARRASRSAPPAWPPNGPGRTSGCRSRGRRPAPRGARCSGSPRPSPAALVGAWIGARLAADACPRTRAMRLAAVTARPCSLARGRRRPLHRPRARRARRRGAPTTAPARRRARRSTRPSGSTRPGRPTMPTWLTATAWQGGGLVVDRAARTGAGVYRTTRPIPVHGDWKALIRLHDGRVADRGARSTCPTTRRSPSGRRRPSDASTARSCPTTRSCSARQAGRLPGAQGGRLRGGGLLALGDPGGARGGPAPARGIGRAWLLREEAGGLEGGLASRVGAEAHRAASAHDP